MRIHTNVLTERDFYEAEKVAGVQMESFSKHGSRSREKAFNVLLSGASTRNAQSNNFKAATWDQWGIFLNYLFQKDEDAKTDYYDGLGDFEFKTDRRFESLTLDQGCPDHRWEYYAPGTFSCKREACNALRRN